MAKLAPVETLRQTIDPVFTQAVEAKAMPGIVAMAATDADVTTRERSARGSSARPESRRVPASET